MAVYFVQDLSGGPIKIGTSRDVPARIKQLEASFRRPLALLGTMPGGRKEERAVHERFSHLRFPGTEQFRPESELLAFIGRPLFVNASPLVEAMRPKTMAVRLDLNLEQHASLMRVARSFGLTAAAYARMAVLAAMNAEEARIESR